MAFKTLSWGKPSIYVSPLDNAGAATTWSQLPTPANGTTSLDYAEGTEYRAEIEGGELEGYKRGEGNFTLNFTIRLGAGTTVPITDSDGAINTQYTIKLVPEDSSAPGIEIKCATGWCAPKFSSDDGMSKEYHLTAITPEDGSAKIVIGTTTAPTVSTSNSTT